VRRASNDPNDLFHAHIGGMDALARGLLIAHRVREEGTFRKFIDERYGSFRSGIGSTIMSGKATLADAEKWILAEGYPVLGSGRQEMLENLLNAYIE
jgi:xylose isomerase